MTLDAVEQRALRVRHKAAVAIAGELSVDERWDLLLNVLLPSPALAAASEQQALDEIAYWERRRAAA